MPSTITAALVMYGELSYTAAVFVTNMIIATAASFVITKVFGQMAEGGRDSGVRQQVPPSATNAIPVVYGDAWLGGAFVDAVLTTDQKTMYYVMVISHISPNGQFTFDRTKFYYGDRLITFDSTDQTKVISLTDSSGNSDDKISGYLYINLYTSTAAGVITNVTGSSPSVVMGGTDIDASLRWPSSGRQMNGLAFAIIKLNYSQDAGTTGLSPVTFKVSHYLNGTGVAKPGDVLYDYLTSVKYGAAVSASNVDATACSDLNNYSDIDIPYTNYSGGSSLQPRYRINGVLDTDKPVLENIDKIVTACDSWFAYKASTDKWTPIINKDGLNDTFSDQNIIGPIRFSVIELASSINRVEAKYPDKYNKDQESFVYQELPSGSLYANEPINKLSTSFDLVNNYVQAYYLTNRILLQNRADKIVSFDTAYPGIQSDVGDVIVLSDNIYGVFQLYRIMKISEVALPDGSLGARIEAAQYDSNVYNDPTIVEPSPPPSANLPAPEYFSTLSAPTVVDKLETNVPATFSVSCTMPTTGRITQVTLFYTTVSNPTPIDWQVWTTQTAPLSVPFANGSTVKFSNIILPIGSYYFGFQVANEQSKSAISPLSSVLNWQPNNTAGVSAGFSGSSSDDAIAPITATCSIRFTSNGLIQESSAGSAFYTISNWYIPTTTNIGSTPGYWLYATVTSGTLASGTTGSWVKLDANRDYTATRSSIGINSVNLSFQISSSSTGTPVVGYGTGNLTAMQSL